METLITARKRTGLTQAQVGQHIAATLGRNIGPSYAQKKIARFENGAAAPAPDEREPYAQALGITVEELTAMIAPRAPQEAVSVIDDLARLTKPSLIAACCLSRARPQVLEESYRAIREAVEAAVHLAIFVPYPQTIGLPKMSNHLSKLAGYYGRVRQSLLEFTHQFNKSLTRNHDQVALYFPSGEFDNESKTIIPPVFRQFTVTYKPTHFDTYQKELHMWTPAIDTDTSQLVKPTGVYSVEDQIDAWEGFFGNIGQHWVFKQEFLDRDEYWERVPISYPQASADEEEFAKAAS